MAVGANTYGSVEGVERLVGDAVEGRSFSGSTVPTTTQVEAELDAVASDLNRELEAAGYTVPVDSSDYPTAYEFLTAANNYGAAARVLGIMPTGSYNPGIEEMGPNRAQMYEHHLKHALKMITKGKLKAGRDLSPFEWVSTGSRLDDDGYVKQPLFTRDMTDYPGVRSLSEDE